MPGPLPYGRMAPLLLAAQPVLPPEKTVGEDLVGNAVLVPVRGGIGTVNGDLVALGAAVVHLAGTAQASGVIAVIAAGLAHALDHKAVPQQATLLRRSDGGGEAGGLPPANAGHGHQSRALVLLPHPDEAGGSGRWVGHIQPQLNPGPGGHGPKGIPVPEVMGIVINIHENGDTSLFCSINRPVSSIPVHGANAPE